MTFRGIKYIRSMKIPVYRAYRFIKPLKGGTTRPWQILADSGKDSPELYVLKLFTRKDLEQQNYIAHEIMGSVLAKEFDLNTPDTALIELDETFLSTVPAIQYQDWRNCSQDLMFGSKFIEGAEFSPALHMRYLNKDEVPSILAFDMLIANTDRNRNKPNLLISERQFQLIDHERAFGYDKPATTKLSYLIQQHLLYKRTRTLLRKRGDDVFDSFQLYLESLRFKNLGAALKDLQALGLAGQKEQDWLEYLKNVQREPSKFINLLSDHFK